MSRMIEAAADKAPNRVATILKKLAPVIAQLVVFLNFIMPKVALVVQYGMTIYNQLPKDIIQAVFGIFMCFFGGTFAVTIAAVEAFVLVAYDEVSVALGYLITQALKVKQASEYDDTIDDDGDGIADVDQISTQALFKRKMTVFLVSIDDPMKVHHALAGIAKGMSAVIGMVCGCFVYFSDFEV